MRQEINEIITGKVVYSYDELQVYLYIANQGDNELTYTVNGTDYVLASGASFEGDMTFSEISIEPATTTTVLVKAFDSDMSAGNTEIESILATMRKGMSGDLVWVLTPATVTPVPTAETWTRDVVIELQAADGSVHEWFNDVIASGISIANTSVAGTASIASTTLTIVNGTATITVTGDAESWLDEETDTLTVTAATIMGYTVSAATSVETFTAV